MVTWVKKHLYRQRAKKVADYYDHWSARFLKITDTFQGYRTENIADTHSYTIQISGLGDNMKILDAGCGVGGPAFYFSAKLKSEIYALTNSKVQMQIMSDRKRKEDRNNIHPILGDYHQITRLFEPQFFDAILFLESLGHSYYPEKVIRESYKALKPGGILYIRDPFRISGKNKEEQKQMNQLVNEANGTYVFNHIYFPRLESALKDSGFHIQLIQKPALQFFNINPEFERQFNIKSPSGHFIDTLEIRAIKP